MFQWVPEKNSIKYPPFHTCRHLLQNSSMTLDTMSDLTRDIMELADNDITDKVGAHSFQKTIDHVACLLLITITLVGCCIFHL